ncbi:MAG: bifunctional folylpolyglutamate synthase/dihydrofolate synthase [Acetobacteraceae bacterium]|nr:bifunctional folylpolyglutamate synthase/dihydrofolate synthase [Acetobacteraceae bacterium]
MSAPAQLPARIEAVIERLHTLYPRLIDLSLERLQRLLAALGHPERNLPPVLHVAGTNGKGSTCAFLRAIGEAAGRRVHVATSPHLVRFNERIRLAGEIVGDEQLLATLDEIEQVNAGAPITVFEVLMAATFLLFARVPAELVVLEVGLGGRFDATNVVDRPAACAIASISMDHREMLGDTLAKIAFEKAGIIKPGIPVATGLQPPDALAVVAARAAELGAPLHARDHDWYATATEAGFTFRDAAGILALPRPSLPGVHQIDNAGIAVATIRASGLGIPDAAIARGIATAVWPARMQLLTGALTKLLQPGWELWLDGGHNPGGGQAIAEHIGHAWTDRPTHLVVGMKKAKDTAEFLAPLLPLAASIWAVSEPGQYSALPVDAILAAACGHARPGPTVVEALRAIPPGPPSRVLICGSLYLAGEVLKADGWPYKTPETP